MLSVKSIQSERERWADGQRYKSFDKNSLQRKHVIAEVVVVEKMVKIVSANGSIRVGGGG